MQEKSTYIKLRDLKVSSTLRADFACVSDNQGSMHGYDYRCVNPGIDAGA